MLLVWQNYLQLAQEPDVQPEQDEPEDASEPPFSLFPAMPNADIFLSGLAHLHLGHATLVVEYTSISNSSPQRGHLYS
jgi:hypothetical protein